MIEVRTVLSWESCPLMNWWRILEEYNECHNSSKTKIDLI